MIATKHFLRLFDLDAEELFALLDLAAVQKAELVTAGLHATKPLEGHAVAVVLEKPSVRTRISFERGCSQLGAQPIMMAGGDNAFSRGESVKDTVKVLERYCDAIVLRTFGQSRIEEVASYASVPVVNALTNEFHPCQGLADLLTIREHKGFLSGLKLAYLGDGNNMAATYLEACALTGMHARIATPMSHEVPASLVAECEKVAQGHSGTIVITNDPQEAVKDADVVITDTWVSMGEEDEQNRGKDIFGPYQVNQDMMDLAAQDAIFMHCLPAHRGQEVTDEVIDAPYSAVYDEAENRLHAQKALLTLLLDRAQKA